MIKKLGYILAIALFTIITNTYANTTNFNARLSDWSSYLTWTSFTDWPFVISSGSSLDIETIIMSKSWSWTYKYNANMPIWFKYISSSLNVALGTWACNPTWIQYLDSMFTLIMPNADCIVEIYTKYQANQVTSWKIDLIWSGSTTSLLSSINIDVINTNTIIGAETQDLDADWYIESYKIKTAKADIAWNFSSINVAWASITWISQSWSADTWIIWFTPWIYNTQDTPEISWTFWWQNILNNTIAEVDRAPMAIKVNYPAWSYTWSKNIVLTWSEFWNIYYSTWWVASESSAKYLSWIVINSNSTLNILTKDSVWNTKQYSLSYTFICSQSAPANWSMSSYPSCAISCNSWYSLSWQSCNQNPSSWWGGGGWWGWWWGGWMIITSTWNTIGTWSSSQTNSSSWSTSTWSNQWWTNSHLPTWYDAPDFSYQTYSDIWLLDLNTLDKTFFKNLTSATVYLLSKVTKQEVKDMIYTYEAKMKFEWISYYLTYDYDFIRQYNNLINKYVIYFLRVENYYRWDNSRENLIILNDLKKWIDAWVTLVSEEKNKSKIYFSDIESSFAKSDIIYLALKNIVKWYDGNVFKPENPITRAEYLWIMMKLFNVNTDENIITTDYSDIPQDWTWMIKYVEKAKEYSITWQRIWNKKIFRPNDPISRAEALAILFKIANIESLDTIVTEFEDIPYESRWVIKYLNTAKDLKIVSWQVIDWALKFRPNDPISRAEASRMMIRTKFTSN